MLFACLIGKKGVCSKGERESKEVLDLQRTTKKVERATEEKGESKKERGAESRRDLAVDSE